MIEDPTIFLNEFSEEIIYRQDGVDKSISAVVTRELPEKDEETGHSLKREFEILISNNETDGVIEIKPGEDKVKCSLYERGPLNQFIVAKIISCGDMWSVRIVS